MADSDRDASSDDDEDSHPSRTEAEIDTLNAVRRARDRARHLSEAPHVSAHLNQQSEQAEEDEMLHKQNNILVCNCCRPFLWLSC